MTSNWLRSLELSISFSEFKLLPRHPAYKYEYFDSRALLTPRPRYARAVLRLAGFSSPSSTLTLSSGADIRPLEAGAWDGLPELLAAAFNGAPPFATLSEEDRLSAARDCVEHTRAGGDGPIVEPACFAAWCDGKEMRLEGAILITLIAARNGDSEGPRRPHLTWVMVHPWRFGRGLGSALLASAAGVLRDLGYAELVTTFLTGNERSALWHWRNGFRLLTSAVTAG